MVVSYGGQAVVVYELEPDQVRARLRELAAYHLDFPIDMPVEE